MPKPTTGAVWAPSDDPRITPLGGFTRRTRLDELPQLWNVLNGRHVACRARGPSGRSSSHELTQQIPFYGQRHVVRPGLTGWAQVRYTYGAQRRGRADRSCRSTSYYIKNLSLALDLFIILSTIKDGRCSCDAEHDSVHAVRLNAVSVDVEDYSPSARSIESRAHARDDRPARGAASSANTRRLRVPAGRFTTCARRASSSAGWRSGGPNW